MAAGRCAGCGEVNNSCKVIKAHVLRCPEYLNLYKTNPGAALEPEKEYERWKLTEADDEKQAAKDKRRAAVRTMRSDKQEKALARWQQGGGLLKPAGTPADAPPPSNPSDEALLEDIEVVP